MAVGFLILFFPLMFAPLNAVEEQEEVRKRMSKIYQQDVYILLICT